MITMAPDLTPPATTSQTTYELVIGIPVGAKGNTGATGAQGPEPILTIKTVNTLAADQNASVRFD